MDSSFVLPAHAGVWSLFNGHLALFMLFTNFTDCYIKDEPLWYLEEKVMGCQ